MKRIMIFNNRPPPGGEIVWNSLPKYFKVDCIFQTIKKNEDKHSVSYKQNIINMTKLWTCDLN